MKIILSGILLLIALNCFSQGGGTSCAVCPPSLKGVTTGWVLTDSSGKARWQAVGGGGAGSFWKITGNSGTNPSTNFIGTTDAQDLVFKVNNNFSGIIGSGGSTALGYQAYSNNIGGFGNSAFGWQSLFSNTNGQQNCAFGEEALQNDTSGTANAAVGVFALGNNYAGNYLTAIGNSANVISDGINNSTAIGANCLIGQSNSIILGDSTLPLFVGVGTSYPDSLLHHNNGLGIRGKIAIVDGTQGTGKIATSDANGLMSWQNHLGTQANHLLYAYIDTVHTLGTSIYVGNAHVSQTTTGTGITTDSLKMIWKGDLSGTNTAEPTVSKFNNQLPAFYLARANQTGTQLASTISDFATATNTQLSALSTYTTPALATTGLGSGKPYILSTTIGVVNVLLLSITP